MNSQSAPYMNQGPVASPLPISRNPNIAPVRDGRYVTPIPELYSNAQGDTETPATKYPTTKGSPVLSLPLEKEGPADFFPSVCLQTHWDPTMILKRTLPDGYVAQSLDPRPWTRICLEYTTAGEDTAPPELNPNIVMPQGGEFYPVSKYMGAIDDESKLHWLDRPLGTCEGNQWQPNLGGDMFNSRLLVPERKGAIDPTKIEELAYPQALLRSGPYDCRAQNDAAAIQASSDYIFNNATKQDRYKQMNKGSKPAPPSSPLKAAPEQLRPDLLLNAGPPRPVPVASPLRVVSGSGTQDKPVYVSGSDGGMYYNPSDLASALAKNQQMRAASAGVPWNPTGDSVASIPPENAYGRQAANQRAELQVNAVAPINEQQNPVTFQNLTTPFSENSPWSPF